jgi:arylsulfatase
MARHATTFAGKPWAGRGIFTACGALLILWASPWTAAEPALLLLLGHVGLAVAADAPRPNIVFILADDLGYGDLGCYGQTRIRTPHIDRLAAEGLRFTAHYSGSNMCAPSRCVLMTGMHPGHAYIRNNRQARGCSEGQEPVPAGELRLPPLFKRLGYTVGGFGKWGLGPVGSSGAPGKQGFDRFFGYNCQAAAHNYYPTYLWDNDRKVPLNNPAFAAHQKFPADADPQSPASYARFTGSDYRPISSESRRCSSSGPPRPPVFSCTSRRLFRIWRCRFRRIRWSVQGQFPEEAYLGDRGYLPHLTPRAAYAR